MYRIDFISAECYPAAKVGGLADVVGSLPKYINKRKGHICQVIMPLYGTAWFQSQKFKTVYSSRLQIGDHKQEFQIKQLKNNELGFPLFCINLPGLFDRDGIYSADNQFFQDEAERNLAFQRAYLDWILYKKRPDIIHCHDHHTALIPYMTSRSFRYQALNQIPTVFTIHNGQYHGAFSWKKAYLIEDSPESEKGLLDWDGGINPLSSAIRCAWRINTVSPQYMNELSAMEGSFQALYKNELSKASGILNGIDYEVWDPATDDYLVHKQKGEISTFKKANKEYLCSSFQFDTKYPLFSFIGRFAHEKGVDILVDTLELLLKDKKQISVLILGTGDNVLEKRFKALNKKYPGNFHAELSYNEGLAHKIYAGSDFLLMPSRVEPCGLNQMYSMRYGTIPIVHGVGGLEDTIIDSQVDKEGNGIKFYGLNTVNLLQSIKSAVQIFKKKTIFKHIRKNASEMNLSWEVSCKNYLKLYHELKKVD